MGGLKEGELQVSVVRREHSFMVSEEELPYKLTGMSQVIVRYQIMIYEDQDCDPGIRLEELKP